MASYTVQIYKDLKSPCVLEGGPRIEEKLAKFTCLQVVALTLSSQNVCQILKFTYGLSLVSKTT